MAVAVAAQACLPVLRLGLQLYDGFVGIVMHATRSSPQREVTDEAGVVHRYGELLTGEAMEGGPVMLSWRDVAGAGASAERGYNVVIHEFVHVIDMIDGVADGVPPLPTAPPRAWLATMQREYDALLRPRRCRRTRPRSTRTAPKRSTSSFAVAVEAFFVARRRCAASTRRCTGCSPTTFGKTRQRDTAEADGPRGPAPRQAQAVAGSAFGLSLLLRRLDVEQRLAIGIDVDRQPAAVDQAAEQQLVGQRAPDRVLDQPLHRPRTHQRVEALLGQVLAQRVGEGDLDLLLGQLALELQQELVDHAQDDLLVERAGS